jgi:hypothetical protein
MLRYYILLALIVIKKRKETKSGELANDRSVASENELTLLM